ncbi:MAG: hypothetical protein P4M15_07895 [Alphaproteobacteria bacterium]|nr:hypothetical protein [Alphaproteobacteria bacterium]
MAAALAVLLTAPCSFAAAPTPSGVDTLPGASGTTLTFSIQGAEQMRLTPAGLNINLGTYPQGININANQIWTTSGTLYLQGQAGGANPFSVVIGTSSTTANNNNLYVHGGLISYKALPIPAANAVQIINFGTSPGATTNANTFGGSPQIFVNGDNRTGGGIAISDDGGFYDYNDGWITFNGNTMGAIGANTGGFKIAGNSGPSSTGTLSIIGWLCINDPNVCTRDLAGGVVEGEYGAGAIPGTHAMCTLAYQDAGPKGGDLQIVITGGTAGNYTWALNSSSVSGWPNPYYMSSVTVLCVD